MMHLNEVNRSTLAGISFQLFNCDHVVWQLFRTDLGRQTNVELSLVVPNDEVVLLTIYVRFHLLSVA